MPVLNGSTVYGCPYGAAYFLSGNVVYLTGAMTFPFGFSGEIAVLPTAERPTHYLYMIAYNDGPGLAAADQYVTLRIDPDGTMWIFNPSGGETGGVVTLSGLSFHTGS
jgi:hypothetical protein